MPWGVAAAAVSAGASIYDSNQQVNAQKAAIAPLQAANSNLYNRAEAIANTPYTPYTGTQVAPLAANQQQALNAASTNATNQTGQNDIAAATNLAGGVANNGWNAATAAKYMNPYTSDVTNVAEKQLNRSYANTINAQDASAASAGAFGGDRQTLQNANDTGQYLEAATNTSAELNNAAYQSAIQTWQADNQRALGAAQSYQQSGNDITQMNAQQIKDLLATGGVQQATQQMDLNAKYNNYLDQRGWAANELQPLLSATSGKGTPAGVTPTNTATDLMGIGSALAGYFGSNTNPPGNSGTPNINYNSTLTDTSQTQGIANSYLQNIQMPSVNGQY